MPGVWNFIDFNHQNPHYGGNVPCFRIMTEKRRPHYALTEIKARFADPAALNRSYVSKQGADALGMDDDAVVSAIQALAPTCFDKSMTSVADHKIWQDVYKPFVDDRKIYVKFTLDARNQFFLISFKEE